MAIISGVTFLADQPTRTTHHTTSVAASTGCANSSPPPHPRHNQQQRNTLQERRTTKMDFTWFKSAGLAAVQNFAHAILVCSGATPSTCCTSTGLTLCRSGRRGAHLSADINRLLQDRGQKTSTASGE
ncbi:hypothetical protein I552_10225 [Mycobacterium xenopi 3993]|nr:hypothetical protein I552_10225 [Mycobacterium xenopi 3993]